MLDSEPPAHGSPALALLQRWGRPRLLLDSPLIFLSSRLRAGEMGGALVTTGLRLRSWDWTEVPTRWLGRRPILTGVQGLGEGSTVSTISGQLDPELLLTVNNSLFSRGGTERSKSQLRGPALCLLCAGRTV